MKSRERTMAPEMLEHPALASSGTLRKLPRRSGRRIRLTLCAYYPTHLGKAITLW